MRLPVLLLDDDEAWLQICLAQLPQTSYALEPTVFLSDALSRLEAVRHPVAICDVRLIEGEEGGFELLDKKKDISQFTTVIVVSARGGKASECAHKAWKRGADNYFEKPYRPAEFAELDQCIVKSIEDWRHKIEGMVRLTGYRGPELEFLRLLGVDLPPAPAEPPHAIAQPDASIVRIYKANRRIVGAGFLVNDRHVLTCAHVVAGSLGLPPDAPDAPQDDICIDFPRVACDQFLTAHVVYWQPDPDIAGLKLTGPPPVGSKPARLITAPDMWGHSFRALGFPTGHPQGVWASGILQARVANDWLQIVDTVEPGYRVEPGFSGSPVWDELLRGVVGIVVAADTQEQTKAAFLIPTDVLLRTWPDLASR
jgi:ActR/RegA family two-component response regulator